MKALKKYFRLWTPITLVLMLVVIMVAWNSCHDDMEGKLFLTSDDVMIDDYITQKDPDMALFLEIADVGDFRGLLHAYGEYTIFIPTNDAVNSYLQALGKPAVQKLTKEECADIVKYHVIPIAQGEDSLSSARFIDGRLPVPNMQAKYLTTRTVARDSKAVVEVNRQAIIVQKDIRVANGFIQKIDQVLIPPANTTGEQVAELPDNYSLFKSLMQKTGWVDSMSNKADKTWYTVFLQSDEAFAKKGIDNEDKLLEVLKVARWDIAELTNKTDKEKNDSLLWTFAAYHVVKSLNYVADLAVSSTLESCAPNQMLSFLWRKDSVLINEFINPVMHIDEKGAAVVKSSEYTDFSCFNGVLVDVGDYIGSVKRSAMAVYWDVCDQPEWRRHSNFRQGNIPEIDTREFADISIYNENGEKIDVGKDDFKYVFTKSWGNKSQYVNHDNLTYRVAKFAAIEFRLPILTEGVYNVWFCYRRDGGNYGSRIRPVFKQVGVPDQELRTWGLYINYDKSDTPEAYLNRGMKRYTAKWRQAEHSAALLFGTISVKSTGRHILRIDVINKGTRANNDSFLDMIHFIPVDDEQLWPRFDMDGNMCWENTPCDAIYPYGTTTTKCPEDQSY
jgi:uncharacterized surface protein with fasciclin (FAS1) repeats